MAVDIGAGTGVLTRALVDAGATVTALELDPALSATLRRRFADRNVRVVETNACRWSWPHERFKVVWRFLAHAFHSRLPVARALRGQVTPRELRRLAPVLGFDASSYPRDLDARQWASVFAFARNRRRL